MRLKQPKAKVRAAGVVIRREDVEVLGFDEALRQAYAAAGIDLPETESAPADD